jgi:hypothetical protein
MENLSGTAQIQYVGYYLLISLLTAGLKMAYCAERDEEFHVSTVFSYYTTAYFAQILWQLIWYLAME